MQNIGAYGQELESTLVAIEFLDEGADAPRRMSADELELGYRTSVLKRGLRGIVVSVEFELHDTALERAVLGEALGQPIAYAQLADALHVHLGDRVPIARVRESVLGLRASKGMVLDPADPDSVSAGSFFTNPIVTERVARTLPGEAPRWYLDRGRRRRGRAARGRASTTRRSTSSSRTRPRSRHLGTATDAPPAEPLVKLSAAWLIEQSGIRRGFALPGSRAADLVEAHAGPHEPGRRVGRGGRAARPLRAEPRAGRVRHRAAARAGAGGRRALTRDVDAGG